MKKGEKLKKQQKQRNAHSHGRRENQANTSKRKEWFTVKKIVETIE